MYGDSPRAVSYWVTRFKARGREGLTVLPRSGRPSKLSPKQFKMIERFIAKSRVKRERVSGFILSQFIKKSFGCAMTRQQCRRILVRLSS
jgi:transposase